MIKVGINMAEDTLFLAQCILNKEYKLGRKFTMQELKDFSTICNGTYFEEILCYDKKAFNMIGKLHQRFIQECNENGESIPEQATTQRIFEKAVHKFNDMFTQVLQLNGFIAVSCKNEIKVMSLE